MQPVIYYCYDAYCGWCYGFSPVIKKIAEAWKDKISFEVLSGGMIPKESARPVGVLAGYISGAYKTVEELTGIRFGEDYLWHIFNPDQSDWIQHSEKSAAALCIFKEIHPDRQVAFAADLQYALHYEGRDLTDDEAYRHLLVRYGIPEETFYSRLNSEEYTEKARYEFALCKQLQVTGFPQVLIRVDKQKFYLLAKGYTDYDTLNKRVLAVWEEIQTGEEKKQTY
ncbi:MAG: DsbA family protein [Sphingobacteriales bacterium]|nr:DsbA family protein [Sphingobacteriales bacterium]